MGAVYNGLSHRKGLCSKPGKESFWDVGEDMNKIPTPVPRLKVKKFYGGSHSAEKDQKVVLGK
jgi:hypothetical protein